MGGHQWLLSFSHEVHTLLNQSNRLAYLVVRPQQGPGVEESTVLAWADNLDAATVQLLFWKRAHPEAVIRQALV